MLVELTISILYTVYRSMGLQCCVGKYFSTVYSVYTVYTVYRSMGLLIAGI